MKKKRISSSTKTTTTTTKEFRDHPTTTKSELGEQAPLDGITENLAKEHLESSIPGHAQYSEDR